MSINLLVENEEDPVVWRGPVIAGAVKQFWTDVVWKDVDFLFVDIEAIRKAALLCRGVYSAVAREHGWGRAYVCSVMAGRNSSEHVLRALEEKLKLVEQPDQTY